MRADSLSDKGPVRAINQDCGEVRILRNPRAAVLTVCDGMGGANSGELASAIALNTFLNRITTSLQAERNDPSPVVEWMRQASEAANQAVYRASMADPAHEGMGTTLVSAVIIGRHADILHVGDSRAYLLRDGVLTQLTRDHSLVEEMVAAGLLTPQEAECHSQKNIITRAIGVEPHVEADVTSVSLSPGDRLLLCSDGLTNTLSLEELGSLSLRSRNAGTVCHSLVTRACELGARDNVTAAIAIL